DAEAITPERARTSDSAGLVGELSGLNFYNNGGISSVPAIHGLADERVNVLVNGMEIGTACVLHMKPPPSYIYPSQVGRFSVVAGITPVSRGGDSLGGSITIDSPAPEFARPGHAFETHGGFSGYHRTNGVNNGGSAWLSMATGNFRLGYIGSY